MTCNKCKQGARFQGDSWCLACAAWEQVGSELSLAWPSAGARLLATDLLTSTLRQLRAVRRLGHTGAGGRLASGEGAGGEGGPRPSGSNKPPEPAGPPPGLKAAAKSSAKGEEKRESKASEPGSESEEASSPRQISGREPLSRTRRRKRSKSERTGESESEERAADQHRSRQHRSVREGQGGHSHKRRRPDHRGGRNHQRLYRAREDPYKVLHHKKPGSFWDRGHENPRKEDFEVPPGHY